MSWSSSHSSDRERSHSPAPSPPPDRPALIGRSPGRPEAELVRTSAELESDVALLIRGRFLCHAEAEIILGRDLDRAATTVGLFASGW
jgi:hypothetical protein